MPQRDDTARQWVDDGALLLDVRTPGEFATGHPPGAVNIPVQDLKSRLSELESVRPVVVYCRSGMRSRQAVGILKAGGFTQIHDMARVTAWEGGFDASAYMLPLLLVMTLGLAPFSPEPHLFGKLRWVAGGAVGMEAYDWFDLLMHGAPFLWLFSRVFADVKAMLGSR